MARTITLSDNDIRYLAAIGYREQGNAGATGIQLTAQVVLNRIVSDRFQKTVAGVINAPGQFDPVKKFGPVQNMSAPPEAVEAIKRWLRTGTVDGFEPGDPTKGATFFRAPYARDKFGNRENQTLAFPVKRDETQHLFFNAYSRGNKIEVPSFSVAYNGKTNLQVAANFDGTNTTGAAPVQVADAKDNKIANAPTSPQHAGVIPLEVPRVAEAKVKPETVTDANPMPLPEPRGNFALLDEMRKNQHLEKILKSGTLNRYIKAMTGENRNAVNRHDLLEFQKNMKAVLKTKGIQVKNSPELSVDGKIGPQMSALAAMLKIETVSLQTMLNLPNPDGKYGPQTAAADNQRLEAQKKNTLTQGN